MSKLSPTRFFQAAILACLAVACTTATASAATISYTISATTTENTSVTGSGVYDTGTQKFTSWDIIAAPDSGALGGGIAGGEWTNATDARPPQADSNGFNLVNHDTMSNFLILSFLTQLTGTPGEVVTIWANVNGGSYRFGSAIENLGAGCCQTHITGTITASSTTVTPEPSTWATLGTGFTVLLVRRRTRRTRIQ